MASHVLLRPELPAQVAHHALALPLLLALAILQMTDLDELLTNVAVDTVVHVPLHLRLARKENATVLAGMLQIHKNSSVEPKLWSA